VRHGAIFCAGRWAGLPTTPSPLCPLPPLVLHSGDISVFVCCIAAFEQFGGHYLCLVARTVFCWHITRVAFLPSPFSMNGGRAFLCTYTLRCARVFYCGKRRAYLPWTLLLRLGFDGVLFLAAWRARGYPAGIGRHPAQACVVRCWATRTAYIRACTAACAPCSPAA